jgi:uncharacterized protein YndB with AHSA1/START domain
MAENDALARFIDRHTIEYVRVYPHPIERVWRAVTDPAEVSVWFFPPAQIDARVGGAYRLGGPESAFAGVVEIVEPPRLIRYGGPEPHGPFGYWQFTLDPVAGGTRMLFVQSSQPGAWRNTHGWPADPPEHPAGALNPWRPGTLGGWHAAFAHLEDLMGGAAPREIDEGALEGRYRALMLETQP